MSPVTQPSHVPAADVLSAADDIPTAGATDIANTAASTTTVNPNSVNRQSGANSDASGESDSEGFILDSLPSRKVVGSPLSYWPTAATAMARPNAPLEVPPGKLRHDHISVPANTWLQST